MSHLPPELIIIILEHDFYTSSGKPDYAFLSACSLVCRAWSWPAQSLLFRCVTRLRGLNYSHFAAAVRSTTRGQSLGECVRTLEMSIAHSMKQSCSPLDLVNVLKACPSVYELALSAYGISKLDQATLAQLRDAGKGLKALHLVFCTRTSSTLFQLLNIWPSIQFLKIRVDIGVPSSQVLADPQRGAPVRLYDLALSSIPDRQTLEWLLSSSTDSLRILDLRVGPLVPMHDLFTVYAPRLRSLRFLHFNFDAAALVRECTALEELVLYQIPKVVPLAPHLPQTIEHLSFRNPSFHTDLTPILDAIDVLPKLRVLTCDHTVQNLQQHWDIEAKCEQKHVSLEVTQLPSGAFEHPVVVSKFPRRWSVSSFARMN